MANTNAHDQHATAPGRRHSAIITSVTASPSRSSDTLPARSPGVLLAALADRVVAYDVVTETLHHLNSTAGLLLGACDGRSEKASIVSEWATTASIAPAVVTSDLDRALTDFERLGLIGRTTAFETPPVPTGSTRPPSEDTVLGLVHRILDCTVRFRGTDPYLVRDVDEFLGTGHDVDPRLGDDPAWLTSSADPSSVTTDVIVFDLEPLHDGGVRLVTDREWDFPSLASLCDQLTSILNEYAVWSHGVLSLHAGAARSPRGHIVVMPAISGAGKSTLTAALLAAGWDHLGDEAIGVDSTGVALGYPKRLALGPQSRRVLRLEGSADRDVAPTELRADVRRLDGLVGPLTHIVFPEHRDGARPHLEPLEVVEVFDELLRNTLNLARIGQIGLETLCHLAETVPAHRLVHGDAPAAVPYVVGLIR